MQAVLLVKFCVCRIDSLIGPNSVLVPKYIFNIVMLQIYLLFVVNFSIFLLLIFIIIIQKDRQCKAGRERLTPYQSEDPSLTLPTYKGKEEKGKIVEDKKGESN